MELILTSFVAGILTVLSPCVLPLLPVIIGGSISNQQKFRPLIITISLAVSVVVFTLLLKTSTVLIGVSPDFLKYFSGGLVIFLGLINVFPKAWDKISAKLHLGSSSEELLAKSKSKKGILGPILIGASLGPVFSSCSPTYALIIATVLPASFFNGFINLIAYALGMSLLMLLIAAFGQKIISKVKWMANPYGLFRKILGFLFVLVGLAVITGFDVKVQTFFAERNLFDATKFEAKIFNSNKQNLSENKEAPELVGIQGWINSKGETIKDLKGKVVIIDFWTYSCINCIRTIPYLNAWYDTYKNDGFVILGIHAPEFQFEKDLNNVKKAVEQYGIKYPVGQDNDFKTWKAYDNQYWPGKYLIDKDGKLRYIHYGEGDYLDIENKIRMLLLENGGTVNPSYSNTKESKSYSPEQSPETYLGYSRAANFAGGDIFQDTLQTYTLKNDFNSNQWSFGGRWNVGDADAKTSDGKLNFKFSAKEVYLVMGSDKGSKVKVKLNGKDISSDASGSDVKDGIINVKDYRLYRIVNNKNFEKNQILELTFEGDTSLNAFTFGS